MVLTVDINNNSSIAIAIPGIDNNQQFTSYTPPVPTSFIDDRAYAAEGNPIVQFPSELPKYYTSLLFSTYSRQNLISIGALQNIGAVYLPLPVQMNNMLTENWQQVNLDVFLGTAINAIPDTVRGIASGNMPSVGDTAKIVGGVGGSVAASLGGGSGLGQGVVSAVEALAGIAPNQFMTILFAGPKFKQFQLVWRLGPRNADESERLRLLIETINNNMSPTLFAGGSLFQYPSIVQVAFQPNSKYLYKFKPAVITGFTANYTPGGAPAIYHNADSSQAGPEGVEIHLSLLELEYWLNGNFTDSTDPYDVEVQAATTNPLAASASNFVNSIANTYNQYNNALQNYLSANNNGAAPL